MEPYDQITVFLFISNGLTHRRCSVKFLYDSKRIYQIVMQAKEEIGRLRWVDEFKNCTNREQEIETLFKYITDLIFENTHLRILKTEKLIKEICSMEEFMAVAFADGIIQIEKIVPLQLSPIDFMVEKPE